MQVEVFARAKYYMCSNHIERENISSGYRIRLFAESDKIILCQWFRSNSSLNLVSSDRGHRLTRDIIDTWTCKSLVSVVATDEVSNAIGFFTLSTKEAPYLPFASVELCHLIVKPGRESFSIGQFLCIAAKNLANKYGFSILVGRVTPRNRYGLKLAIREGFGLLNNIRQYTTNEFFWFAFELSKQKNVFQEEVIGIYRR